jgi:hypothetical protein
MFSPQIPVPWDDKQECLQILATLIIGVTAITISFSCCADVSINSAEVAEASVATAIKNITNRSEVTTVRNKEQGVKVSDTSKVKW